MINRTVVEGKTNVRRREEAEKIFIPFFYCAKPMLDVKFESSLDRNHYCLIVDYPYARKCIFDGLYRFGCCYRRRICDLTINRAPKEYYQRDRYQTQESYF